MVTEQFRDSHAQQPIINSAAGEDILILYPDGGRARAVKSMLEGLSNSCHIGDDVYITALGSLTFVCIDDLAEAVGTYNRIITLDIPCDAVNEGYFDKLLRVGDLPNYHSVTSYTKE